MIVRAIALLLRLAVGLWLAWSVGIAVAAPEIPILARAAALVIVGVAVWRPAIAFIIALALVAAGSVLAPPPASAAELLAWAFLSAWLLAVWRPLIPESPPRDVTASTLIYATCIVASWLGLAIAGAGGVHVPALPTFAIRGLPTDHLIFSSPEPEAWNFLHAATGIAFLAAGLMLARRDRRVPMWAAGAVVASMAALGLMTVSDVLRQWALAGYEGDFLLRYVRGVRGSFHLADLNAAGSQYVLALLIAGAIAFQGHTRRRWLWLAAIAAMLPALWLCGSRSAVLGAILAGSLVLGLSLVLKRVSRPQLIAVAVSAIILVSGALVWAASVPHRRGSAGWALWMREEFLQTSVKMFLSAPLSGVGIGKYYPRSAEFMTPELHAIYRFENAHNYFAQQFAELGIIGGVAFLVLIALGLRAGWSAVRGNPQNGALRGLFAGTAGYLLTCLTGHPLLVPEAALPFWGAFGALAASAPPDQESTTKTRRTAVMIAALALAASLGVQTVTFGSFEAPDFSRPAAPPAIPERGFHDQQTAEDGTRFRWITRHAVTFVRPDDGFLIVPVRAPEFLRRERPFVVQIEVDGASRARTNATPDGWTRITIPLRERAPAGFRRVDIRVNQAWTARRDRGPGYTDTRPMSVMVGPIVVQPLSNRTD